MVENKYQRRVVPWEAQTWANFIRRHKSSRVLGYEKSSDRGMTPEDVIAPNVKNRILREPMQNLRNFLMEHDIEPPNDNLIDRLMVVNNVDFEVVCILGASSPANGSLGACLPNRLCIVNADLAKQTAEQEHLDFENLICLVGTHEIVHTLTYQEYWASVAEQEHVVDDARFFRRNGVFTSRPPASKFMNFPEGNHSYEIKRYGLSYLAEGMVQYVTYACLSENQRELLDSINPYSSNLESVRALISDIGEEPLIKATFTKQGLRGLSLAVGAKLVNGV